MIPLQDNADILEAYVKSWTTGALDKAVSRRSAAYELVLHHLSSFLFHFYTDDKLSLRHKLARSLLRDSSLKLHHEVCKVYCYDFKIRVVMISQQKYPSSFFPSFFPLFIYFYF